MEILILALLIGAGVWFFLRRSTQKGTDTVRAFVFLRAVRRGASIDDANREAQYDVADGSTHTIRQTMECVRTAYGGRQLALIEDAKRAGFVLSPGEVHNQRTEPFRQNRTDLIRALGNGSISVPPLSQAMVDTSDTTIHWCRQEISNYVGRPVETLPDYGFDHDLNVGSYICGFLQGQLLQNESLRQWAGDDPDLEYLGYYALAVSCLPAVLGRERTMKLIDYLPQIGPGPMTENIRLMDTVGGNAGMDHAAGRTKNANLYLSYYLERNVAA